MMISLNMIWLKGVFRVCTNSFKTSYDLIRKKKNYTIKHIGEIVRVSLNLARGVKFDS